MAAIKSRKGRNAYTNTTHTRVLVEFHSDQNPDRAIIALDTDKNKHSLLGHLFSLNTHKGFDGASGSFTLVFKKPQSHRRQQSLLRLWQEPEDVWVDIFFIVEGQKFHVLTGLVDTFNESMDRSGEGTRTETYTLIGRDEGKIFETTDLWLNPFDKGAEQLKQMGAYLDMFATHAPQNGSPSAWIKFFLQGWFGNNGLAVQQWSVPSSLGGGSFYDKLSLANLQNLDNGKLANGTLHKIDIERGFGRLWDVMGEYSNDLLNEFWIDLVGEGTGKLQTGVYLRQRPFPTFESKRSKWESIRYHTLEKYDIAERNMSKGGASNRYNYWSILHNGHEVTANERAVAMSGNLDEAKMGKPGGVPIWNQDSINKHGIRRWQKSTIFLDGYVETGDSLWPQLLVNWLRRAHDWYSVAPMQLQGTITTARVFPEIRIGTRLIERRDEGDVEYYVEAVDHYWSYPKKGYTILTVTRGQYVDDDLLKAVYSQLDNPATLSLQDCSLSVPVEDAILQGCKFTPQSVEDPGDRFLTHGGEGFEVYQVPDRAELDNPGNSLTSEGADLKTDNDKPDAKMLPAQDAEDAQALEIIAGNANAKIRRSPSKIYDRAALQRGEDPLAGYDTNDLNNDPIGGLDL